MGFSLTKNPGGLFSSNRSDYFDPAFCRTVDSHKTWLMLRRSTSTMTVTAIEAYRFTGDFYGLLTYKGIDPKLWYAAMRLTDIEGPTDTSAELRTVFLPSPNDIDQLMESFKKNQD